MFQVSLVWIFYFISPGLYLHLFSFNWINSFKMPQIQWKTKWGINSSLTWDLVIFGCSSEGAYICKEEGAYICKDRARMSREGIKKIKKVKDSLESLGLRCNSQNHEPRNSFDRLHKRLPFGHCSCQSLLSERPQRIMLWLTSTYFLTVLKRAGHDTFFLWECECLHSIICLHFFPSFNIYLW